MLPAHHFVYGIVILANSVQGFRPPHPCFAFPTKVSKLRACSTASAFCSDYLGADASFTRTSNVKTTIGTPTVLVTTTEVVESTAVTGTISTSTTTTTALSCPSIVDKREDDFAIEPRAKAQPSCGIAANAIPTEVSGACNCILASKTTVKSTVTPRPATKTATTISTEVTTTSTSTTVVTETACATPTPVCYSLTGIGQGGSTEAFDAILTADPEQPCSYDGSRGGASYSNGLTVIGATGTYNGAVLTFDNTQTVGSPDYCYYPASQYAFDYLGTVFVAGDTAYNFFNGAIDPTKDRVLDEATVTAPEQNDPQIVFEAASVACP